MKKKIKNKLIRCICPGCGCELAPIFMPEGTPEPWISLYPCGDCKYPERAQALAEAWKKCNREILMMAAKGESFDANGNQLEPIRVLQTAEGYEIWRYAWTELLGLHEISHEFQPYK